MYRKNRRLRDILRHSRKTLVMVMAMVIAFSGAIGGTLAWLTDKTQTIKNTFTVGDISIKLEETDADGDNNPDENRYEMNPGGTINKDPKVTVLANSKACWLFVQMEKSAYFDKYLTYDMADGWTALDSVTGVYYRKAAASATDQEFEVIKGNTVNVKSDVDFSALIAGTENLPTLEITAYAIQQDSIADAKTAWENVKPTSTTTVQPQDAAEPVPVQAAAETAAVRSAALTEEEESAMAWKAFLDSGNN